MNLLVHMDAAKREIAAADTIIKAKTLRDKSEAVRQFGIVARDKDLIARATEFKVRAERRLGELLAEMKERGEVRRGQHGREKVEGSRRSLATLADVGITRDLSSRAQKLAKLEPERFEQVVEATRARAQQATTARPTREAAPEPPAFSAKSTELAAVNRRGVKYATVYADPPWRYGNQATRSSTDKNYPTMTVDEICALPVPDLIAPNAQLHLWTTNAFLFDAKRVIDAWGFEYKSVLVWVKPELGIGNYWRVSHEFLLLGVRGSVQFRDHSIKSWHEASRLEHSQKPELFRTLIERVSPSPRLELFGRRCAKGWTVWGNEITDGLFDGDVEKIA